MFNTIDLLVRILLKSTVAFYLIYRLWRYLFRERPRFWEWFTPESIFKNVRVEPKDTKDTENASDTLIGKSRTVLVLNTDSEQNAEEKEPIPAYSEDLELSEPPIEEEDIRTDDVAMSHSKTHRLELSNEDLFYPLDGEGENYADFPSGLTYEQMSTTIDVIREEADSPESRLIAAATIYDLKHTDMFALMVAHATNVELIDQMLEEYTNTEKLNNNISFVRSRKEQIADFDINRFV